MTVQWTGQNRREDSVMWLSAGPIFSSYEYPLFHFVTFQMEDKAFSPLLNGNTGPLHYHKEQMCSKCVCPDTHYRRVRTLSVCLCCRSSSLCGCYRSHLSLALCFIPFLPHQIADRFYSCSVPGGTQPPPTPTPTPPHQHTRTHKTYIPRVPILSSIWACLCRDANFNPNRDKVDGADAGRWSADMCRTVNYDSEVGAHDVIRFGAGVRLRCSRRRVL